MAMDATLQVRMDKELKAEVEDLYRSLGTTFAEAVRIFAQQSLRVGGMPFTPSLKTWDEYTQEEIDAKLEESLKAARNGEVISSEDLYKEIRELFGTWKS
jgi:DNA-damage-inducible protein J